MQAQNQTRATAFSPHDNSAVGFAGRARRCPTPLMDSPHSLPFQTLLPRPQRGGSTRVQLGSNELVLESVRGGHSLLWLDGREARRFVLGLDADGELTLQLRAPKLPVRIAPREVLAVVPGGRLRGYLQLPLVPTIVWRSSKGLEATLLELPPRDLAAEWDETDGTVYRCTSSLHVLFPMLSGEPKATVPIVIRNLGDEVLSPAFLPMQLRDADLVELRASLVVAPCRMTWNGQSWSTTKSSTVAPSAVEAQR
jgi:hypothetical protein